MLCGINNPTCLSFFFFALADCNCCCCRLSSSCLPTFLSVLSHYVSSFFLNRIHKKSLLDLDDSAACDCRHHLCFSLLVRSNHTKGLLSQEMNPCQAPIHQSTLRVVCQRVRAADITQEPQFSPQKNFELATQRCSNHHKYVR